MLRCAELEDLVAIVSIARRGTGPFLFGRARACTSARLSHCVAVAGRCCRAGVRRRIRLRGSSLDRRDPGTGISPGSRAGRARARPAGCVMRASYDLCRPAGAAGPEGPLMTRRTSARARPGVGRWRAGRACAGRLPGPRSLRQAPGSRSTGGWVLTGQKARRRERAQPKRQCHRQAAYRATPR